MMTALLGTVLTAVLLLIPVIATAQDAIRSPFDPALLATYGWIILISLLGGFASFYRKVQSGATRWANLAELVGELFISATAGLITYWLARWANINEWATAALIGIAGHMGSRAFFVFERVFEQWIERVFGSQPPKGP